MPPFNIMLIHVMFMSQVNLVLNNHSILLNKGMTTFGRWIPKNLKKFDILHNLYHLYNRSPNQSWRVICTALVIMLFLAQDPCVTIMRPGEGNCQLPRWYYDLTTKQCLPFIYKCMKGSENNFLSKEQCETVCLGKLNIINSCQYICDWTRYISL